jgi:hypothetical protein
MFSGTYSPLSNHLPRNFSKDLPSYEFTTPRRT